MLFIKKVGFLIFLSVILGIIGTIYRIGYTESSILTLHTKSFLTTELEQLKIDGLIATVAEEPIIGAEIWITVKDNNGNSIDVQRFDVKGVGFSFFEDIYSGECPSSTGSGVAGLKAIGAGEGCKNGFDECGNKCVASGNSYKLMLREAEPRRKHSTAERWNEAFKMTIKNGHVSSVFYGLYKQPLAAVLSTAVFAARLCLA